MLTSDFSWSISYTLGVDSINVRLANFLPTCASFSSANPCISDDLGPLTGQDTPEAGNQDSMESKERKTNKTKRTEKGEIVGESQNLPSRSRLPCKGNSW